VEDQQPDPGDLTTEDQSAAEQPRRRFFRRRPKAALGDAGDGTATATVAPSSPAVETAKTPVGKAARAARSRPVSPAAGDGEPATVAGVTDETVAPDETDSEADSAAQGETPEPVVLVPHRPAPKGLLVATALASVVFVGASAFAAAMAQPYIAARALVQTKLEIARTATDAITTLWTYTPEDMATLADRASAYLDGGFADEYRRYIDAIVEPNKQAQVTNTTQVMGAAVESVSPQSIPTEATALVYTNSVATSPVTKNIPALRYLSYRLTMQRDDGEWRITRMSTITSFDLTPQL
jgi:Mce-associated membrane protein